MNYNRSDAFFISILCKPSSMTLSYISIIYLSNSLKDAWVIYYYDQGGRVSVCTGIVCLWIQINSTFSLQATFA